MPLLAHLIDCFRDKPENIATMSLAHILRSSNAARDAMQRLLSQDSVGTMQFVPQERTTDAGQPDLVALDGAGKVVAVIEVKFWAGLTDHQPQSYLKILPTSGLLLFIAPRTRLETLWSELSRRCTSVGLLTSMITHSPWQHAAGFGDRIMALESWDQLLKALEGPVKEARDASAESDLSQLRALCEQMDATAFMPLRSEELTDALIPRRFLNYRDLVTEIADSASRAGCFTKGNIACGHGYYGVNVTRFGELDALLAFSPNRWSSWNLGPIWLQIGSGPDLRLGQPERTAVKAAIEGATSPRTPVFEDSGSIYVPVILKPGRARDELVQHAVAQLQVIANSLPKRGGAASDAT